MAGNLYIMTDFGAATPTDNGTRPYQGTSPPFWANASMFLEGGVSQSQTKVGMPTVVKVRVTNSAASAIDDVSVDAYVMSPFIGLVHPSTAIHRLTGFASSIPPGSGTQSNTDAHIVTCKIQDPVSGAIPWTPTAADLSSTQNGHLCLIANVYADGDGAFIPDSDSFNVAGDAHQGQRNIAVLAASEAQHFKFQVMPLRGRAGVVEVRHVDRRVLDKGTIWQLGSHHDFSVRTEAIKQAVQHQLVLNAKGKFIPIRVAATKPVGHISVAGLGSLRLGERVELPAALRSVFSHLDQATASHPLTRIPWTHDAVTSVELSLLIKEQPGSAQVTDVVQRDAKGAIVGGLRVITVAGR